MSKQNNIGSEKGFGIVFSIFFLILSIYCFIYKINTGYIFVLISIFLLLISFTKPKILKIPNFLWYKLSIALSMVTSPIIMFFIYSVSILPIGVILKLKKLIIRVIHIGLKKQTKKVQ